MDNGGTRGGIESAETLLPGAGDSAEPSGSDLRPGAQIDRYVLLGELGRGGMSTVYKAFDPKLDRPVALKVVDIGDSDKISDGSVRLGREAQAIARLSHPNVVAVHDIGFAAGNVFIAMEFVDGVTLRLWSRRKNRGWREVVKMYLQAARGLAAAHSANLVHRDFKPDNVIVGDEDGRARVLDFGLVRAADELIESSGAQTESPTRGFDLKNTTRSMTAPLTIVGEVMGTPGYMAPEQYTGEVSDESSDQFSFCAALFEALYGHLPFEGNTLEELKRNVLACQIRDDKTSNVPRRLRAILLRGLRVDKRARFPSMTQLIQQLERVVAARARIGSFAVLAGSCAMVAAIGVVTASADNADSQICEGATSKLSPVWSDATKQKLRASFLSTGADRAGEIFRQAERDLDQYSAAWTAKYRQICQSTRVHHEQTEATMELRLQCMDRQLEQLRQTVLVLGEVDTTSIIRAAIVTGRVPDLQECDQVGARERLAMTSEQRTQRWVIEAAIARAKALCDAGRFESARDAVRQVELQANNIGDEVLSAQVLLARSAIDRYQGNADAAQKTLEQALVLAERSDDDLLRARVLIELVFVTGYLHRQPAPALVYARSAKAILSRVPATADVLAQLASNSGVVYQAQRNYARAAELFEDSLRTRAASHGDQSYELVASLNNLGSALTELGRNQDAVVHLRRAVHILEGYFGQSHPNLAAVLVNLGIARAELGELSQALVDQERAIAIYEQIFGPRAPLLAPALANRADILADLGRLDDAEKSYRRSLLIREHAYGENHPYVALTLLGLGKTLSEHARHREGLALLERARAIWTAAYGEQHYDVARALHAIGTALRRQGKVAGSIEVLHRAVEIVDKALGPDHVSLPSMLRSLADSYRRRGQRQKAIAQLERGLAIATAKQLPAHACAELQFSMARALAGVPGATTQAVGFAKQAEEGFANGGELGAIRQKQVSQWLAAHPAN